MEANGLTHPTSHSSRFLNSKCYHAWQITPWFCATTTSNNPCFLTDAEYSELISVETPPVEAESESRAYRQPSCSPSDPAGTCWTAARRACSPRRWEPTSCPGSDRRQMSTPPGTSRRWAGWCPADATLASWSYRGSSGRCETGTPSAPCWGRETRSLLLENQRRLNHHLRNQKMIMRDSPMLGWCTNEQMTHIVVFVPRTYNANILSWWQIIYFEPVDLQHERPEVPQDVFLQCNTTVSINRVNPSTWHDGASNLTNTVSQELDRAQTHDQPSLFLGSALHAHWWSVHRAPH